MDDVREPLPPPYDRIHAALLGTLPPARVITDPLRRITWGTDASFYRLVPKIVVVVEDEQEVVRVLGLCAGARVPVTFRAAGTSLSGQAISDSVLVVLGDGWRGCVPSADGATIALQPGVIGAAANRRLAPFARKIGPDPASIDAAMIGGIAANNASGMCCGTAQNSYQTLAGVRVVLADGTVVDTRDAGSRAALRITHGEFVHALDKLASATRNDAALSARIRHKFRMKNTTGYSLNALVDFADPVDVLAHLMIGSEGTLGFISEITYRTVPEHPHKASALILFDDLATACRAVTRLASEPVDAVELADRAALRSVEDKPGLPAGIRRVGPDGAALLVETRAPDAAALAAQIAQVQAALAGIPTLEPVAFSTDPAECARLWNVRKGMFPSVGAMRATGTTVIIEDVAFPVERLADATLDLQRLLAAHGYGEAIIFGHALAGNLHFVFTQDFNTPAEVERYRGFMDALCRMVVGTYDGSLKAEHGTGRNMAPFVEMEWGADAYALMHAIKRLFDPDGLLNPGVVLSADKDAHVRNLKPLPACDALVDKCIECGFCEPKCPSRGLTLSPRQRIVGWREIARRAAAGGHGAVRFARATTTPASTRAPHAGCAPPRARSASRRACSSSRCAAGGQDRPPVASPTRWRGTSRWRRPACARAWAPRTSRIACSAPARWTGALGRARAATGGAVPKWSPALPRPVRFRPPAASRPAADADAHRLFPELRRAQHGRAPRPGRRRPAAGDGRAALRQGGLCGRPIRSACRSCAAASRSKARG